LRHARTSPFVPYTTLSRSLFQVGPLSPVLGELLRVGHDLRIGEQPIQFLEARFQLVKFAGQYRHRFSSVRRDVFVVVSFGRGGADRKSTRLNSSHVKISYA